MNDLIDRQEAVDALIDALAWTWSGTWSEKTAIDAIKNLPSAQPEQTKMIKEIRKWINSGNRGSADYFIVDKIEEIIDEYER